MNTSTFRTLDGAPVHGIPDHLSKLLAFGLKFVPSPHPLSFLKVLMSRLSGAYTKLRRVHIWDIHYMLHPPEVDLFDVLLYPHFFRSKGTMPNDMWRQGICR